MNAGWLAQMRQHELREQKLVLLEVVFVCKQAARTAALRLGAKRHLIHDYD